MQKLVWQNANGVELDLTSGNYGITEWEGFSNTSLNIQQQQVPFQDGGVFLDALIEQRELTVTLAMQDNNNLELRYQQRRELISALNPKLGEGYLIYTNDFISKRIKCVPQIPLFETHNSDTAGTPKASLSWTACEPYWEDLEETVVNLNFGKRYVLENNGDVPCNIKIQLYNANANNPVIRNITNDKKIRLEGVYSTFIRINTEMGKKNIYTEKLKAFLTNWGNNIYNIAVSENLYIANCRENLLLSKDGINWEAEKTDFESSEIIYIKQLEMFVMVGVEGNIATSEDGINWTARTSGVSVELLFVKYFEGLGKIVVGGKTGTVLTSTDGITWTSQTTGTSLDVVDMAYSYTDNMLCAVCNTKIINSNDGGETWTILNSPVFSNNATNISYSKDSDIFLIQTGNASYYSNDGTNWAYKESILGSVNKQVYINQLQSFFATTQDFICTSKDGVNWNIVWSNPETTISKKGIVFSEYAGLLYVCCDKGLLLSSNDGAEWNKSEINKKYNNSWGFSGIAYLKTKGLLCSLGQSNQILKSYDNGETWQSEISTGSDEYTKIKYISEGGMLWIVGIDDNRYLMTSSDGIDWVKHYTTQNSAVADIVYYKKIEKYVAITKAGYIIRNGNSLDSWIFMKTITNNQINAIACSNGSGTLVVVGVSGGVFTSINGTTWNTITSGTSEDLNSVVYADNLDMFVAVGNAGVILTSYNGEVWQLQTSGTSQDINNINYVKEYNMFVAVCKQGEILKSFDGITWTSATDKNINGYLYGSAYNDSTRTIFIAGSMAILLNMELEEEENIISSLTSDSDMDLDLELGKNEIIINANSGITNGVVSYRQKYIGV